MEAASLLMISYDYHIELLRIVTNVWDGSRHAAEVCGAIEKWRENTGLAKYTPFVNLSVSLLNVLSCKVHVVSIVLMS